MIPVVTLFVKGAGAVIGPLKFTMAEILDLDAKMQKRDFLKN